MTVILAVAGPLCLMTLAVDSSSIRLMASETLTGIGAHATDDSTCQPSVSSRVTIAATVASTESSWVGEEMNGRLRLRSTKSRR